MRSPRRPTLAGKLSRGLARHLLGLVGLLGCAPEYELLRSSPTGGTGQGAATGEGGEAARASTAGTFSGGTGSGGSDSGGTDSGGGDSAGTGGGDSAGTGGSAFGGTDSGGSDFGGTDGGGVGGTDSTGGTGGSAGGSSCMRHGECGLGTVCRDYACVACPAAPTSCPGPCSNGFQPTLLERNGCALCECVPPSECESSADCSNGDVCYAGVQCQDDCSEAACCFGNQCSPAGCAPAPATSCLEVGCSGGGVCLAACASTSCECDGAAWQCVSSASDGGAADSCPQACAAP